MTKLSTSIFALATIFAAGSAFAADLGGGSKDPTSADYVAPAQSWTGLWVGALGGYQFSNSELDYTKKEFDDGIVDESESLTVDGLGAEGIFGEVQIGFDKQISQRIVIGAFGGLNLSNGEFEISASSFDADDTPTTQNASILSFEQEWGGVLGLRGGVLTTPNTMFYAAGGWAFGELGNFKSDFGGADGNGGNVFENQETDLSGWFAELGMETRVTDNVYLTVAGRYTDYGAITLDESANEHCAESLELDHDTLTVMAGLKFKLGNVGNPFGN